MNPLGVMQGRLSPPLGRRIQAYPKQSWRSEFERARACGLETIEWIFEADEWEKNAVLAAPEEIRELSSRHGVKVLSVCADYFMDRPLVRASDDSRRQGLEMLKRLIGECGRLGVRYLGLPFVDQSAIKTEAEVDDLVASLGPSLGVAQRCGVLLAFETSLDPAGFASFLAKLDHPQAVVNYDIGNSASLGYDPKEELLAYGRAIATVHVKDRVLGGGTVPLGEGDADFDAVFAGLSAIEFKGPFILQAARRGDEQSAITDYTRFVRAQLAKHFG